MRAGNKRTSLPSKQPGKWHYRRPFGLGSYCQKLLPPHPIPIPSLYVCISIYFLQGLAPPPPHSGAPGTGAPPTIAHHISNGAAAGATPLGGVNVMPVHSVPNAVYATPTYSSNSQVRPVSSTTPSGGPRHGVFSPGTIQYGPPPSIPMMAPPGHSPPPPHHHPPQPQQQPQQPHVQHIGPHHPHWHGTHPPNFQGGDKSHGGPPVRIRDATHERLKKKAAIRQQQQHLQQQFHHPQQGGTPSQHSTPATSPAKRGMGTRGKWHMLPLLVYLQHHLLPWLVMRIDMRLDNIVNPSCQYLVLWWGQNDLLQIPNTWVERHTPPLSCLLVLSGWFIANTNTRMITLMTCKTMIRFQPYHTVLGR